MFSVGVLYSAKEFLELLTTIPNIEMDFPNLFHSFSVASSKAILEISQKCEWVRLDHLGHLVLTEKGKKIVQERKPELALRIQLGHLIESYLPTWIPVLSRGREEAKKYLPMDVVQCFSEAELFNHPNDSIIKWWDTYSKISRRIGKDNKLEIGRIGEKLSIEYERKRTKREPKWQGFETNFAGYDILSVVSESDSSPLRIEVKSSNSTLETAFFHLSENEWNVGITSENYLFHLWVFKPNPTLSILKIENVKGHVPNNNGNGHWESVMIPFSII